MPELLRSAKLAVEKGQAQGRDESYVKQLSDYIIPALVEALHKVTINCFILPYSMELLVFFFIFLVLNMNPIFCRNLRPKFVQACWIL